MEKTYCEGLDYSVEAQRAYMKLSGGKRAALQLMLGVIYLPQKEAQKKVMDYIEEQIAAQKQALKH